jgi:hypothetical protein
VRETFIKEELEEGAFFPAVVLLFKVRVVAEQGQTEKVAMRLIIIIVVVGELMVAAMPLLLLV